MAAPASAHRKHHRRPRFWVPAYFYTKALCVHDGWHYRVVKRGHRATYVFGSYRLARTWKTGSNGEGGWDDVSTSYGGGLQFMLGTWQRAGGKAWSTAAIAKASVREQIFRMRVIVLQDHGSFREWPTTARACGLPVW